MDKLGDMMVFLRVAEEGSFSAAGRHLMLTPSAVSKLIARLEARLNVRLFDRIAGNIRLTQEGDRFRVTSRRAVDAVAHAENMLGAPQAEVSGVLHIHTALTTAKYLLAPHLPAFLDKHPQLRLEFMLGTERGDFAKEGIDLAIHSGRPTELSLIARPWLKRPWAIAASPAYLQRHGKPAHPADLQHHRCLNFTIRTRWNSWTFHENGSVETINTPQYIGANQGELLRTLGLVGLGIVRLAQFHIADDMAAGTLVPLLEEYHEQAEDDMFYVLYPSGRAMPPRVRAFLRFLDDVAAANFSLSEVL
ncbi:MAG: transcriptional regulator, LysR family [Herminiimonas sp.]|nr:transcriptional regulator, LysR family [Herminiimonas sp.]